MIDFLTVQELSAKWGISERRIQLMCANGKIHGAIKRAGVWFAPSDTQKPADGRAGRKIKKVDCE